MNANGPVTNSAPEVLHWSGRVLAANDLRGMLKGHGEVTVSATTIITPLAAEELRASGVRVTRESAVVETLPAPPWAQAQDRPYPLVQSVLRAVEREGMVVGEFPTGREASPEDWARALAECLAQGTYRGGICFCGDPGLVCCIANKAAGVRAVAVTTVAQAVRAVRTLAPNLLAVEMPGRTFFEVRQILHLLRDGQDHTCPVGVAKVLKELEDHAHR